MKAYFKQLFEYDHWASHELFDKFEKQFPQNSRIYELFSHLLSTQRIWLDRILGIPQSVERFQDRLPEEIKQDLENYHTEWMDFIDQLQPEDFDRVISYIHPNGQPYNDRLLDIMAHVINHGTHHRGNLIILMKEEGFVAPTLDLIYYVRLKQ
ncbi:DinB family protein [Mucilaginibacter sp. AW1-3]